MRTVSCRADEAHDGQTAYRVLRGQLRVSDAAIRRAKHVDGGILLDGRPVWANAAVEAGQEVALVIDAPGLPGSSSDIAPEDGPLSVVYSDADIVVVDKPAGLVMYPGTGHGGGTLANRLAGWLRQQGRRCGIHAAHRLDMGTSGLVVFALNSFAKDRLQEQLAGGAFSREYLAICEGVPHPASGTVDVPLGMLSQRPNVYGVKPDGKRSVTHYRTVRVAGMGAADVHVGPGATAALLRLRLETGRTHQIRIHLAHIGNPLVGDGVYGRPSPRIDRPALHSWRLRLRQPIQGDALRFESAMPADMASLLGA